MIFLLFWAKTKLKDLEDFKDVRREELSQNNCKEIIEKNKEYILTKYKTSEIRFHQKDTLNSFVVSALRAMINKMDDYEFVSKNYKNKKVTNDNDKANYTSYSIKKK